MPLAGAAGVYPGLDPGHAGRRVPGSVCRAVRRADVRECRDRTQDLLPEIIPELQQENELAQEYEKLLASAQIPFEGGVYTISQMTPFKSDPDDARRLAAWKADGQWYKDNQDKLDGIYDQLVHLPGYHGQEAGL